MVQQLDCEHPEHYSYAQPEVIPGGKYGWIESKSGCKPYPKVRSLDHQSHSYQQQRTPEQRESQRNRSSLPNRASFADSINKVKAVDYRSESARNCPNRED